MPSEDLKYHPENNPGPLTAQRAFTICELVILRRRDQTDPDVYALLSHLADEIHSIAKTWKSAPEARTKLYHSLA